MRDYGDAASTSRDEKYQTFDIVFVERLNKNDADFPNHGGDILVWSQSLGRKKGYRFTQAQILDNPSIWCDVSLHPLDRRWVNQIVRVWDIDKTKSDVDAGIFYPLKNGNPFRANEFILENDKVDYTVHSASEAGSENGIT
ncbi:MAG: hypothetical protein MJ246_00145 [Clostridia bacterium]|nr:hypothetical protein [Clostridia bacterium]